MIGPAYTVEYIPKDEAPEHEIKGHYVCLLRSIMNHNPPFLPFFSFTPHSPLVLPSPPSFSH